MGKSHTKLAKFIHWSFILLYAYGIFKQVDDLEDLEDNSLLMLEVSFASVFLLIVIMRYFYMRSAETFQGANVPVHKVHTFFAKTVHLSMYFTLIMLPLTGLMIAGLYTQGHTDEDGLVISIVLTAHEFSAVLSYVLIATHVSAAIYSRIKGEGVWSSMVPILKEDKPTNNKYILRVAEIEEKIYDKVENLFTSGKKDNQK
ncbi:MAG: cytochrome b/b6 domain-containing protein [Euryarchaeota archaeon]|nr:cytochrome b/b6 domain-containing protein [Euryarchaeota archaeon]